MSAGRDGCEFNAFCRAYPRDGLYDLRLYRADLLDGRLSPPADRVCRRSGAHHALEAIATILPEITAILTPIADIFEPVAHRSSLRMSGIRRYGRQ
jgi:hypothetical protein